MVTQNGTSLMLHSEYSALQKKASKSMCNNMICKNHLHIQLASQFELGLFFNKNITAECTIFFNVILLTVIDSSTLYLA